MSKRLGRAVTISLNGIVVARAREKTYERQNEIIDISDTHPDGLQHILEFPSRKNTSVSIAGVSPDGRIAALASEETVIYPLVLDYGDSIESGDYFITQYEEGYAYNDAVTFSCSLVAHGVA